MIRCCAQPVVDHGSFVTADDVPTSIGLCVEHVEAWDRNEDVPVLGGGTVFANQAW